MPWYIPSIGLSDAIKKRVCIYLLQRYLGDFLEEKLTVDQLSLDIYNGRGTVENVSLDVQALNALGKEQNLPMEFVSGYLQKVSFKVPWALILKDSTFVEIHGLKLTVQPKQRKECATSMFESMWSSMSNSMQLAQECMNQEASNIDTSQPLEGIEIFAQAIDSILSRVKVKFLNTTIQVEHLPKDSLTGVGLIINIAVMDYSDEAGNDPPTGETTDDQEQKKAFVVSSYTAKNFFLDGITLSTVEFSSKSRTFTDSSMTRSFMGDDDSILTMMEESSLCEDDRDLGDEVDGKLSDAILFGKFLGRQEIRMKFKQSEDVSGPKVSIDINLGGLNLFLSPRQVYVIAELANGISSPDTEDTSKIPTILECIQKPMTSLDYQRVEQELQLKLHPCNTFQSPGLQGIQGWSTAALDESDNDDNFLPMHPASSMMYESSTSNISSSMESSLSSSMASSLSEATSNRTRRKINNIECDPTAKISHFQIKFASLAVVLLHEDLLTLSLDSCKLVPSSVKQMQNTAEKYFSNLGSVVLTGYGKRNFDECRSNFEKACMLNHLRLMAAPIQIECDETTTSTAFSLTGKLTAAKLEILECLKQQDVNVMDYIKILSFSEDKNSNPAHIKPCLKMNFKHVKKTIKSGLVQRIFIPKTEITITLDVCTIEVDITLMDRICALLNSPPVCVIQKAKTNIWGKPAAVPTKCKTETESQIDIKIASNCLTVKLRFPIPDFRQAHDKQRPPWWKRNVRNSFVTLKLISFTGQTGFQTHQVCQKYIVQAKTVDVFYFEKENSVPLHIAKAGVDERFPLLEGFNWPRFVVSVYPVSVESELEDINEPEVDIMNQSCYGSLLTPTCKGPFSAKKVVHESDTPHAKPHQEGSDELVIPGDKQEISDFIEQTSRSARIQLDFSLPTVSLQLISKHVYEVLYNHITSDLLLWEPSAPIIKHAPNQDNLYSLPSFHNLESETFAMCKSGIQYDSDSDSSEDSHSIYHSVYDKRKFLQKREPETSEPKGQSYLTMNLHIGQGVVCINPPVRDMATNVIPEQNGEFVLAVEDINIFSVTGYKGDDNLGYVCVQAKGAQLHHCDMISSSNICPQLKEISSAMPRRLHPTIYKSEAGVLVNPTDRGGDRDMFSVAVKIQANHETHHVKTVRVALGINKATLRHRMCSGPNSWINQLIDFFNVNDYTIPGYNAKDVLTELHLHLWDCAIDYRPFYLPLRSVVTLGTFSMSSHLSATANTSTLRFIAEECGLFVSDKFPPKNGTPSPAPVDLKSDYVSVVDLGLFELSLRTNDKVSGINPHVDLRASNNILNIRTCSDTGRALTDLITYFAGDGDLSAELLSTPTSNFSSPRHNPEEELISVEPQHISNLSKSQHEHVNEMLGEAMQESIIFQEGEDEFQSGAAKMFFFPDEGQLIQDIKPLPQIQTDLGDITCRSNKSSDTDDEFCIIGEEAGLGIYPKNGLPDIRWLTEDSLRFTDNHFNIPFGKTDIFRAPKHFPDPTMRYTLIDMTIVWQLYGGNDFKSADDEKKENKEKKTVNFSDIHLPDAYSNVHTGEVIFSNFMEQKKPQRHWTIQGGVNRDHDVLIELQLNKVRFQHEIYPENTTQASRQVLLITDFEVRDRLKSSPINKFLYQYTSQAKPKQSHANMIAIKALHIRPDLKLKAQECCLRISMLPLRLNIDQDSLLFLIHFFNSCSGTTDESTNISSKHNTPTHQPPVMTISGQNEKQLVEQAQKIVDENLMLLLDDVNSRKNEEEDKTSNISTDTSDASVPIYFRKIVFSPDVPIRLDYHGKRLDLTHGPLAGLLMGLGHLNSSELRLRRLSNNHGILGFDKLLTYCLQEWINDIKKNQLPSLLSGVGPMNSFVQFFQGIRDLFWLPIEQYQKDGRIVRGLQRGANSFSTSTARAALDLTTRIVHVIQITAEIAYDMMSPGPSVRLRPIKAKGRKRRYNQPQDIREGVANAFSVVREGIEETAGNIVRVASHEHEQKGYSGAVGGVLRQIPPTFVKPIIIATEATNNLLGGVQNQLLPDARKEAYEKWKNVEG